jgi:hypothetical protein
MGLDGREVAMPFGCRVLTHAGIGAFLEAFALGEQFDIPHERMAQRRPVERLVLTSPAHLREIVAHLREQWRTLVKTDNLLGPVAVADQCATTPVHSPLASCG